MSHILIWKDGRDGAPSGAAGLLNWIECSLTANPRFFRKVGEGQIGELAALAACHAIDRGVDLTIGAWCSESLWTTPADQLEAIFQKLGPATLVCPERPGKLDRWTISNFGAPASLPAAAIQQSVSDQVSTLFPRWQHGIAWNCTAFLLRHDVNAQELGLVAPEPRTPDMILAEIATDPQVRAAADRADPALPESVRALVAARLKAQAARGIPADRRVTHFSGEIEGWLLPLSMKLGRGDGPAAFDALRRRLWPIYLDLTDTVLAAALRDFPHDNPGLAQLREAARACTPATAA